jgi:hypothetical protein
VEEAHHIEDDEIRVLVRSLSRPHASGGAVIERAAILASGADSAAILAWMDAHDAEAEELPAAAGAGGLDRSRINNYQPTRRRGISGGGGWV